MNHVLVARWVAAEGQEEEIERILREMTEASLDEPGCREYRPHRSLDDPATFLIFERYDDAAALDAHRQSEHFQRLVLDRAIGLLVSRSTESFQPTA